MIVNTGKTEFIAFGRDHTDVVITVEGTNLPQVTFKKVLGVTLQEDMSFCIHTEETAAKGLRALSALSPLMAASGGGPSELGAFLYKACIRPILELAYPTWCTTSRGNLAKLENVQRLALKAATGIGGNVALSVLEVATNTCPLRLRLDELLCTEMARILSKEDSDPIKAVLVDHFNERATNPMKFFWDPITIAEPLLAEIGTSVKELADCMEFTPITTNLSREDAPKIITIDDGTWGSTGTRNDEQKQSV